MYDYSKCAGVQTLEGPSHHYPIPGVGILPSITTVNSAIADKSFLDRWRRRIGNTEAERISFEARDRGSLIHAYLEARYNLDPTDPDTVDALARVSRELASNYGDTGTRMAEDLWRLSIGGCKVPWAQEVALWSEELLVAGRCDMIGAWHGVPSIIDFKTSRRPKRDEWIADYWLQTTFYAMAHNELFGTNIEQVVILITVENAPAQTFVGSTQLWEGRVRERCADYYRLQWASAA